MSIEPCFNLKLRQADRVLTSHYDSYLRELGIKATQFAILRVLSYLDSASQKRLQEVLVLNQTTLTRNLKPLIRDGYIITNPGEEDRRVTVVSLSPEGKALFKQGEKHWKKAQAMVASKLGAKTSRELLQVAEAILEL